MPSCNPIGTAREIVTLAGWFGVACAVPLATVPALARLAHRFGFVDQPDGARRIHARPTPRAIGLAVLLALAVSVAGFSATTSGALCGPLPAALLGGGALLAAMGLVDDRWGVRPATKIAAQATAALVAWALGVRPDFGLASVPVEGALFVAWVVLVTNSFNLIDGMDGLAGSVALVALAAVGVYGVQLGNYEAVSLAVLLAGGVLGFLRFNNPPARVFLGDTGSLFIGYALALLTLAGAARRDGSTLVFAAVCALPLPLLDTATAVARRWLRHRPLFSPDARHIHHRLLAVGYRPRGVLALVFIVSLAFAAFGTFVSLAPRVAAVTLACTGAVTLVWFFVYCSRHLAYHEFVEALAIFVEAPRRMRRAIRARIMVRDLLLELGRTETLAEVALVLHAHACDLGFARLSLAYTADLAAWTEAEPLHCHVVHPIAAARGGVRERTHGLWLVAGRLAAASADGTSTDRVLVPLADSLREWVRRHAGAFEPVAVTAAGGHGAAAVAGGRARGARRGALSPRGDSGVAVAAAGGYTGPAS